MTGHGSKRERKGPISRGLRFQILAVLAIALLPIGGMGILQTRDLAREVQSRSDLTLLALTNQATFGERQIIERAFGAAQALSTVLKFLRDDPERCRRYLQDYLGATEQYSFVGFMETTGEVNCSSADRPFDLSSDPRVPERMENIRYWVDAIHDPAVSTESVLSIMYPAMQGDNLAGYIAISTPIRLVLAQKDTTSGIRPNSVVTFNIRGEILTSQSRQSDGSISLPENVELTTFTGRQSEVFVAKDQAGQSQRFTVVPIIPDLVFALAAWPAEKPSAQIWGMTIAPELIPLLMFGASLAVAYIAVNVLVVQNISRLRFKIREFAATKTVQPLRHQPFRSAELEELETSFTDMAASLLEDEAQLEDALREKNVLVKEIHHRVKNNLQLISSIMSIHIRNAEAPETKSVLRQLQERVLGLSVVHKNLYQAENLSRTDAGRLLSDLFDQLMVSGAQAGRNIAYEGEFDPVILVPDQAVPLSLIASELVTNALKYVGSSGDMPPRISASLKRMDDRTVQLRCENTLKPDADTTAKRGTGLGRQLVRTFVSQLNARITRRTKGDRYRVTVEFEVEDLTNEPKNL